LRTSKRSATTDTPEELVELLAGCDTNGNFNSTGNVLPQIKRPWGFNDWAPQTNDGQDQPMSWMYDRWWFRTRDTKFHGMRCTHQPSPWMGDYASFLVQPHVGDAPVPLSYSPSEATFRPHLFKAALQGEEGTDPIDLEFTATSRAALLRVGFKSTTSPGRVSVQVQQGSVEAKDGMLTGVTQTFAHAKPSSWKGMFFVVKPVSAPKSLTATGKVGTMEFSTEDGTVIVALATSFISEEQAIRNLEQELGSNSFDQMVQESQEEWRSLLGRAKVQALGQDQLRLFYTNMWRAQLFPRHLHEVDAKGKEVHFSPYTGKVTPGRFMADSGFWDAYKTVYVLQSIVAPDNFGKTIAGWVQSAEESGWLPQWPSPDQSDMMVGTMGDAVLADAIAKHKWGFVEGFDIERAYNVIRKDAFEEPTSTLFGRVGLSDYIQKGYVPTSKNEESVALTLGYYLADAAISNAATLLGKSEDAEKLSMRSKQFHVLFSNETEFFVPKGPDGQFDPRFDPLAWRNGYTEGNAWHSRFDVPHDVEALNTLYGGKLCEAIRGMMTYSTGDLFHEGGYGRVTKEMNESALVAADGFGQYAHSNQPVHHVLYIAKKAGCNELGDKYLRKVMQKLYTLKGWIGDEDNGEMGAWYTLSALGIYQMEGGKDEVILGSPAVVSATLDLPHGKTLSIKTEGQSEENVYVQSIKWAPSSGEAREVSNNLLKFTELMAGGSLSFVLGSSPSRKDAN